eukprot:COSAG01_NODE_39671_length_473_cov_1.245989_1_plen_74_part_01
MAGAPTAAGRIDTARGESLALYTWAPTAPGATGAAWAASECGVAVLYHGYGAHARYPTVQWAADVLCRVGLRAY